MSRRPVALLLALTMVAVLPGAASAAAPIAGDDPGQDCIGGGFGGSFPIPEDYGQPFPFVDGHVCGISYNDSDPDGDPLSYALVTPPAHGELEYLFSFDSTIGYTPEPDYFTLPGDVPGGDWESDSFVYEVTAGGETDQATMRFWIAPVNDAPSFTSGGAVTVAEDSGAYSATWATAISEGPGEAYQSVAFDIQVDTNGVPGLFSVAPAIAPNGTLTFTPAANKAGIATVTVILEDDGGLESYSGVTLDPPPDDASDAIEFDIIISAAPDAAVAVDDAFGVDEDAGATTLFVLGNDSDADGDPFVVTGVTQGGKGSVAIAPAGAGVVYDPDTNATGEDTFTYTITGGDMATVTVTIDPQNDPPTADDDAATVLEDAAATSVAVLVGDADPDGDTLDITAVTQGTKGTVAITGGGTGLTYDPTTNFNGSDSFTYTISDGNGGSDTATVTMTITPQNDPPTADDDTLTVLEDATATAVAVLVGDADIDGDTLTINEVTQGTKGVVVITGGGTGVTYDPATDATGSDAFTYTISDGNGGSDTATVSVTITAQNDPPTADDDAITVLEDAAATSVAVLVGDADIDGDELDITSVTQGSKGTVAITGGGTGVTYDPTTNLNGSDSFTYTISDGNGGSDTATVNVTITAQNDPPTADDDSVTVLEDANATAVPVLLGDSDVEGDDLDIIAVTQGAKGTVVITGGGTGLTYKPGANTSGADAFTYTISDGNGGSDTATVTVTITPVQDDTPNAVNDSATIPTGPAVAIPVLANDTDLDGDPLTITSRTNGTHGTVVITGGGTGLTYDPAPLFSGTDQFTYTVFDGFVTDTATVLVTVLPDTAAPTLSGLAHSMPAQILGGSSPRVRFQWGGSDPGSGIANYHLQLSVNGGAFVTVALSSPTATAYERALASNTTYQFRLRAKDKSGNISAFSSFASLDPVVLQEGTSLATYTGTWSTSTNANMSGGKGRFTSSSTRRVAFTFTGKGVGWVTTRTTSSGRAAVYLDGALITTIDLDASSIGYRRMVYRSTFATAGRHTLEIRPLGDGRVDIDAFVILR